MSNTKTIYLLRQSFNRDLGLPASMYGLFTSKPELRPSGFESEVTGVKPEGKLDNPDSLHTPLLTRMEGSIIRIF